MKKNVLMGVFASFIFSSSAFASDLTGIWQSIDDKTGSPKALIEITKAENGSFTGKIIKVTPRPGYSQIIIKPIQWCNELFRTF